MSGSQSSVPSDLPPIILVVSGDFMVPPEGPPDEFADRIFGTAPKVERRVAVTTLEGPQLAEEEAPMRFALPCLTGEFLLDMVGMDGMAGLTADFLAKEAVEGSAVIRISPLGKTFIGLPGDAVPAKVYWVQVDSERLAQMTERPEPIYRVTFVDHLQVFNRIKAGRTRDGANYQLAWANHAFMRWYLEWHFGSFGI